MHVGILFNEKTCFLFCFQTLVLQKLSNILHTALFCYLALCEALHLMEVEIYQNTKQFLNCFIDSSSGGSILFS